MKTVEILTSAALFATVEAEEITSLLTCLQGRVSDFPREYTIIDEGQHTTELGVVLKGEVHIVRHDFWGNRSLVMTARAGESFAEALSLSALPSEISVITAEVSTVLFLNAGKLITSCEQGCPFHSRLIGNMVALLSQRNHALMQKINHLTKRTTREKLLSYLYSESKRQNSLTITIGFDRQQLADYLCVERSAMSAELSKMQRDGLLHYNRATFTLYPEDSEAVSRSIYT
ncbi:MAG TPA: Crp/Fnr family transcriptional regulator [Sphaerochaeta sp.]|nr:Crp/Fnr family transcriptional regulator [Sphaerochaeta sp.]